MTTLTERETITLTEDQANALKLCKPPFHHEHGYIWDVNNEMVADFKGDDGALLRVRGWGRISYLPNPERLQDAMGELIAKALTEFWETNLSRTIR